MRQTWLLVLIPLLTACAGDLPPSDVTRSDRAVKLLAPQEEVSLEEGFQFLWEVSPEVKVTSWQVKVVIKDVRPIRTEKKVFVRLVRPVWESELITGDRLTAPAELMAALEPGVAYHWRVVGRRPGGGIVRSELSPLTFR